MSLITHWVELVNQVKSFNTRSIIPLVKVCFVFGVPNPNFIFPAQIQLAFKINKEIHHHPEYYCISRMHGLLLAPIIYIIASQPISFQRLFRKTNSVEPVTSESEESTDMKGKKIQKRKWDVQSLGNRRKEVYKQKRKAILITIVWLLSRVEISKTFQNQMSQCFFIGLYDI